MTHEPNPQSTMDGQRARIGKRTYLALLTVAVAGLFLFYIGYASRRNARARSVGHLCSAHLRSLAISCIFYGQNHGGSPHMAGKNEAQSEEQVSDAFQSLIYLKCADNSDVFVCPNSEDFPIESDVQDPDFPRSWSWKGQRHSDLSKAPVHCSSKMSVFSNLELSYTMRRRLIDFKTARSDTMILADKALRTSESGNLGNHRDGFNIAFSDGHVEFYKLDDKVLLERLHFKLWVRGLEEFDD
ncbi:MAG: hypothetical protein P1V97_38805, partial [Planctomycetota bacterium]|nr:hypothetical protein [Planctomycetota bacterium]